jgi:hypothetical protein
MAEAYTWVELDAVVRVEPLFIGGAAYNRSVDLTIPGGTDSVGFGSGPVFKFRYSGAVGY